MCSCGREIEISSELLLPLLLLLVSTLFIRVCVCYVVYYCYYFILLCWLMYLLYHDIPYCHSAPIHPSTYLHPEFLALRNTAVYKQTGTGTTRRRRPNTALLSSSGSMGLHALTSSSNTVTWSAITASRKYPTQVEPASTTEVEQAGRRLSTTSGKFNTATPGSTSSMKQTRRNSLLQQQSSSGKERSNSLLLNSNTTTNIEEAILAAAVVPAAEDSGAAAVAAKMAFEKFLLRLEAVAMYNTWLTLEQVCFCCWLVSIYVWFCCV